MPFIHCFDGMFQNKASLKLVSCVSSNFPIHILHVMNACRALKRPLLLTEGKKQLFSNDSVSEEEKLIPYIPTLSHLFLLLFAGICVCLFSFNQKQTFPLGSSTIFFI